MHRIVGELSPQKNKWVGEEKREREEDENENKDKRQLGFWVFKGGHGFHLGFYRFFFIIRGEPCGWSEREKKREKKRRKERKKRMGKERTKK